MRKLVSPNHPTRSKYCRRTTDDKTCFACVFGVVQFAVCSAVTAVLVVINRGERKRPTKTLSPCSSTHTHTHT